MPITTPTLFTCMEVSSWIDDCFVYLLLCLHGDELCFVYCLACRPNHPLTNPVYECDRSGKDSMAPGNITSNPSYMTAKDVVSTSFAPGTEEGKEIDHTNEVLPFEAAEEGQDDTIQGGGQEATADDDRTV